MGVSFVVFVVIMFVVAWPRLVCRFLWLSRLSLRGHGVKFVHPFCGRHVCLRMVAESNGCSELVA